MIADMYVLLATELVSLLTITTQHWALFNTGSNPPAGGFHHATNANNPKDKGRFDLWYSFYPKGEDNFKLAVAALYVGTDSGVLNNTCAIEQKLLKERAPYGDHWTCSSWAIEVLHSLQQSQIDSNLFSIELLGYKRKSAAKLLSHNVLPIQHICGNC